MSASGFVGQRDDPRAQSHLPWIFPPAPQREEIPVIALAFRSPLTNYNLSPLVVGGQAGIMGEALGGNGTSINERNDGYSTTE